MTASQIAQELDRLEALGAPFAALLTRAVELLHESSERFDWTGIYELCSKDVLRLGPFVGAPTEHVFIAVGNGVCGSALAEKRNMNIPDVSRVPNYLACSAATRSELVVLIREGDKIYGQIDIDSHEPDAFDDALVGEVELLAQRLARSYARHGERN